MKNSFLRNLKLFVLIIIILPLGIATIISVLYGLLVLSLISYIIAIKKQINPLMAVFEHIVIAGIVILISKYLGKFIVGNFQNL